MPAGANPAKNSGGWASYFGPGPPRGTHHYAQFLKPSELARLLRHAGLELEDVSGLAYNPLTRKAWLSRLPAVNYVLCARKPA